MPNSLWNFRDRRRRAAPSIRIGGVHRPLVIQEELLAKRSRNHAELTGRLIQVEKLDEIGCGPLVREMKRTLYDAEVTFDKPENAPEVMSTVVYISLRSVSRDDHQRYAEAVLIVPLTSLRH